jgi:glycosyltransferase involved in cell wall biosynthesis
MKKALIISYTLPPENGIGGRRWAKFAKVLKEKSYDIRVITAQNKTSESPWIKDISTYNDSIIRIPSKYPYSLGILPKSIKEKLLYRLALQKVKTLAKGNYYDKGAYWKSEVVNAIRTAIKDGYNNVIITVAPFKTALWASELKAEFPEVNFIVDFRDPWIELILSKQTTIFSKKRIQYEIDAERKVVETFDYVVSVAEKMTNDFLIKYNNLPKDKFKTIPNGYDENDLCYLEDFKKNNSLIFAGTFYIDAEDKFKSFIRALNKIKIHSPELLKDLNFVFYSNFEFKIKELIKGLPIEVKPPVSLKVIHKIIRNSKACMLFLSNDINYSLSTKFCEYIAYEKPILVFSNGGFTSSFVTDNKIGYAINDDDIEKSLAKALYELKTQTFKSNYNYKQYSIRSIIKDYENLLK